MKRTHKQILLGSKLQSQRYIQFMVLERSNKNVSEESWPVGCSSIFGKTFFCQDSLPTKKSIFLRRLTFSTALIDEAFRHCASKPRTFTV